MKILFHDESSECLISASSCFLNKLGHELQNLNDAIYYESENSDTDGFYNAPLDGVSFVIEEDDSDKIALTRQKSTFIISGNSIALNNFGLGLINIFENDAKAGTHIHYDYLDGHGLTRETIISLVVSCDT